MSSPNARRLWLLALVLILGQWLTVAHSLQHAAPSDDGGELSCALCLHGQRLDHAAAPTVATPVVAPAWQAPSVALRATPCLAPHAVLPPACGPPA